MVPLAKIVALHVQAVTQQAVYPAQLVLLIVVLLTDTSMVLSV